MQTDEPSVQSDADKIRAKRLAMLQKRQAAQAAAEPAAPVASTSSAPAPRPIASPAPVAKKSRPSPPASPAVSIANGAAPKPRVPTGPPQPKDSFEDFEHALITNVFGVTLNREAAEASGGDLIYLQPLAVELADEGTTSHRMTGDMAERIIFTRLSLDRTELAQSTDPDRLLMSYALPQSQTSFEYLVKAWRRAHTARSNAITRAVPERLRALDALKALCISFAGLSIQDPTMFPQPAGKATGGSELVDIFLRRGPSAELLDEDTLAPFMAELVRRFEGDDIHLVFEPVIAGIVNDLVKRRCTFATLEWRESVGAIRDLADSKAIAATMPLSRAWCPTNIPVPLFEHASLLGPLVRLGCFGPEVAKAWFANVRERDEQDLRSVADTLRGTLKTHYATLHTIFSNIARSGPSAREAVLSYFAHAFKINSKRSGMRTDPNTVSTHNFVVGLQAILLAFCEPFMDRAGSKIDKVDPLYYRRCRGRIDIGEETKIRSELGAAREFWAARSGGEDAAAPNFISECFFLTAEAVHLGTAPLWDEHPRIRRRAGDLRHELEGAEAARPTWVGGPNAAAAEAELTRIRQHLDYFKSLSRTNEVTLLDPSFVAAQAAYSSFMMAWLVRLVDPRGQHPQVPIELPLPETAPTVFSMLPEYFVADPVSFFQFVSKNRNDLLADQPLDDLLIFIIVFLSTPYVHNPYIKGQMVEILYYNVQRTHRSRHGALGDVINTNKFALRELMPALMRIYVDIETTGTHSQFFEKFEIRYHIAQIFKIIWQNPPHREALRRESAKGDQFVRFVNLMLNDTTFVMEEALTKLQTIAEIQSKKRDEAAWQAMDEAERVAEEKKLTDAEGGARSYLQLANETINLFVIFTGEAAQPFTRGEIVDRLAAMLDHNLSLLAGPRCQELRVTEPSQYEFNPRQLLRDFIQIFIHLGAFDEFAAAVARDGRSYDRALFQRTANIARKAALKNEDELGAFLAFADRVEKIKLEDEADDEAGEVPDEFLDPLTYSIMRDPVILPKAKQSIDRTTIAQHLLSDPRCPFTSTPLTLDECLPDTELKQRIEEFVAQRRAGRMRAADESAMAVDA